MPYQTGQIVYYRNSGGLVQAIVRNTRPGWLYVEARFFAKENGENIPGYLGCTFTLRPSQIVAVGI